MNWKSSTLEPLHAAVSLLYPADCVLCAEPIERAEYLCPACQEKAPKLKPPFCAICSQPFDGAITQSFSCANCADRLLHFQSAVAAYRAEGVVRKIILDFKYGKQIHLRFPVAEWLHSALDDPRLRERRFDLVVPVPLHPARKRERGFNQAELIAQLLARRAGLRMQEALERIRFTTTQTAYDRGERMKNLRGAFRLRKKSNVQGLRVLLIDDVLTTGSTLSECARVLKRAGAISVHAATAARA